MAANNSVLTGGMAVQYSSPIYRLPTKLLYEIVPKLTTSELRLLGRVNRGLHHFVAKYLLLKRHNAAVFCLPKPVLENIASHLPSNKDHSRLARASQKFYPNLMESLVRIEINTRESNLLCHAAKYNDTGLAAKLLRMGMDVNGLGNMPYFSPELNPLYTAARYGQENMVVFLLEAGASDIMEGARGVGRGVRCVQPSRMAVRR